MNRIKTNLLVVRVLLFLLAVPVSLWSHCQVPCGIYDDEARVKMIAEHITTIEKAMKQVAALSKESTPNYNQIVRWVTNKEKHAEELSDIVTYYFMAQRIKPADMKDVQQYNEYRERLELLHHILVYTMKAKQSVDLSVIGKLRSLLEEFKKSYFKKS